MKALCADCGVRFPVDADPDQFPDLADICKKRDSIAYASTLGRVFGGRPLAPPDKAKYILELTRFFIITTNYDRCFLDAMERAEGIEPSYISYPDLHPNPGIDTPYVVHLHGLAPESHHSPAMDLVLSASEFSDAYRPPAHGGDPPGPAYRFLWSNLPDWSLIIVAYRLQEKEIRYLFGDLAKLRDAIAGNPLEEESSSKTEWVLLIGRTPEPEIDAPSGIKEVIARERESEQQLIQRAYDSGINDVIEYPRQTRRHEELRDLLELASRLPVALPGESGSTAELEAGKVMPGE